MRILVASDFTVRSTYHSANVKSPGKLVLGRDMILPIHHIENFRCIRQRKQAQIEKYIIRKKPTRIDYDYRFGDQVMIGRKQRLNKKTHSKAHRNWFKRVKANQST